MNDKGITAAQLLREAGLHPSLITQWKQGLQKPSTDAIIKLAQYFGVSTDYLLIGKVTPCAKEGVCPYASFDNK